MAWIVVGVLLLVVAMVVYLARSNRSASTPSNPSVIVEMDDLPPADIDFDAGIRANQKFRKARDSKGDVTLE